MSTIDAAPLFYGIVAASVLVVVFTYARGKRSGDIDSPVLAGNEMLNARGLTSLDRGAIAGYSYNLMTNDSGRVMLLITLARNTDIHILAYGDKSMLSELVEQRLHSRWLEAAVLEGDFPDYFKLYCSPSAQMEVREVFEPATMAQFADFCRAYDFELFDDTIFVSQAEGSRDKNDTTSLVKDVTDFLTRNSQMLSRL